MILSDDEDDWEKYLQWHRRLCEWVFWCGLLLFSVVALVCGVLLLKW